MTITIDQFFGANFFDGIFSGAFLDQSVNASGVLTITNATADGFTVSNSSSDVRAAITGAGFIFGADAPTAGEISAIAFSSGSGTALAAMGGLNLAAADFFSAITTANGGDDAPLVALLDSDSYAFDGSTATRNGGAGFYNGVVVGGFSGDDSFIGSRSNDLFKSSGGADTYNGGSGVDAVDYSQGEGLGARGIVVNFTTGAVVNTVGLRDSLRNIEQIIGTDRGDTFFGAATAGQFFGRDGNDAFRMGSGGGFIAPGAGNDSVIGSTGFDFLDYAADTGRGAVINLRDGAAIDPWGGRDTLSGIDQARGSSGDDIFVGGAANDQFVGQAGADIFNGGAGARDEVRYDLEGGASGVVVDLGAGTATDTFGAADRLMSIEVISGTARADTLTGDAFTNTLRGGDGVDAFDGGAGFDTLDFEWEVGRGGSARIVVNLGTGVAIDAFGNRETITGVENVIGTRFADIMVGGEGSDRFEGRGGGDRFDGGAGLDVVDFGADGGARGVVVNLATGRLVDTTGARGTIAGIERVNGTDLADLVVAGATGAFFSGRDGADQFIGGAGVDTIVYGVPGATRGVVVNLATGNAVGDFNDRDTFSSVEGVIGGRFADLFVGGAANETFVGFAGADDIRGGAGFDVADYSRDAAAGGARAVAVNLRDGVAIDGFGGRDALLGIEGAIGGAGNDVFIGDNGNNRFVGKGGDDIFNGEGGFDFVDYSGEAARVIVNLGSESAVDGSGGADSLRLIEGVTGTRFDDLLVGSDLVDRLEGGAGIDTLRGNGGNDVLLGGTDADSFQYTAANWGTDVILDWQDGVDRIVVDSVAGLASLADFTVTQTGAAARLAFGADAIVLANTDIGAIDDSDFLFI